MAKKLKKVSKKNLGRRANTVEETKQDISSKSLSIKTLINSNAEFNIKDLEPLFSTAMAYELGYNHGRILDKLRNPIKLTIKEVHRIALYVGADPEKLSIIVNREIARNTSLAIKLKKHRSIAEMPKFKKKTTK